MSGINTPAFGKHPNWAGPKKEECRICLANPEGPCPYHTTIANYPPCEGCEDPFGCHFTDDGDRSVGLQPSAGCGTYCDHDHPNECPCTGYQLMGYTMDGWPAERDPPPCGNVTPHLPHDAPPREDPDDYGYDWCPGVSIERIHPQAITQ